MQPAFIRIRYCICLHFLVTSKTILHTLSRDTRMQLQTALEEAEANCNLTFLAFRIWIKSIQEAA